MVRRSARNTANAVPVRGGWVLPHGMGIETANTAGASGNAATAPAARVTRAATRRASVSNGAATEEASQQPPVADSTHDQELQDTGVVPPVEHETDDAIVAQHEQRPADETVALNNTVAAITTADDLHTDATERDTVPLRRSNRITSRVVHEAVQDQVETEGPPKRATRSRKQVKVEDTTLTEEQKLEPNSEPEAPTRRSTRGRKQVRAGDDGLSDNESKPDPDHQELEARPKRVTRGRKRVKVEDTDFTEGKTEKPKRVPKKTKDNPYGLTPGRSPFPEWEAPSAEQCETVYRILADMHDDVQPISPDVIPAPSLEVTGCGEVPFVLEALIRTLLSGAVTFAGAAKMLKGIIEKFGILEDGVAKGSIDWNKVRLSPIEDLVEAIREGGLANIKAKSIKATLDIVYQENLDRRAAYLAERETGIPAAVYGASEKTQSQKDLEILKTDQGILSLDHMRGLSADEAMREFTKYPGIGVKTAACVILFCLQIPCFAVDTHVHRFSKWLGWTPPKADENGTFSHLQVRCPDHLKYGLHQLFIRHGQTCSRCKANTAEGTKDWDAVVCPLEHLLTRSKKMSKARKGPKKKNGSKTDDAGLETSEGDKVSSEDDAKVKEEGGEEGEVSTDSLENGGIERNISEDTNTNVPNIEANIDDAEYKELESELSEVDEAVLKDIIEP
ncbi:DNA glycosylase [Xylariaceae sp. FL0594]|nr:DNA glycosylase [Xylariaceae sp. FL0594]